MNKNKKRNHFGQIKRLCNRKKVKIDITELEKFVDEKKNTEIISIQNKIKYLEPNYFYDYCPFYNGSMLLRHPNQKFDLTAFYNEIIKEIKISNISFGQIIVCTDVDKYLRTKKQKFQLGLIDFPRRTKNNTLIIIPIHIRYPPPISNNHINLLIVDKTKKECVIFEPLGSIKNKFSKLNEYNTQINLLLQKLLKLRFHDYKYIRTSDLINTLGPQSISYLYDCENGAFRNNGFCFSWVLLFGQLKIMNPNISTENILCELYEMAKVPYFEFKLNTYLRKYWNKIS